MKTLLAFVFSLLVVGGGVWFLSGQPEQSDKCGCCVECPCKKDCKCNRC
jgi:hypothetical protein